MADMNVMKLRPSSPGYPKLLLETADPPSTLFVTGQPLDQAPHIAVVGTRRPTRYGLDVARMLGAKLAAAGVVVVSGLARGIDTAAHIGALETGKTVAVLGSGVDVCYPKGNRRVYERIRASGSVISEYALGQEPLPWNFPRRNRIIAGMSLAVVVVEGRHTGGAMITARLATEANREVFAVPGCIHSVQSEGPHALIKDGARMALSAEEILAEIGVLPAKPDELPLLSPDESRIVNMLQATAQHLDVLADAAGLPASSAAALLALLELKGVVSRSAGGRFAMSPSFAARLAHHRS